MKFKTAKTLARVHTHTHTHTLHLIKNKENNNLINKMETITKAYR